MVDFKKREEAFEAQYVRQSEVEFQIEAISVKKLAAWAATKMHYDEDKTRSYAAKIIDLDLLHPGKEDVFSQIFKDLQEAGHNVAMEEIKSMFVDFYAASKNGQTGNK